MPSRITGKLMMLLGYFTDKDLCPISQIRSLEASDGGGMKGCVDIDILLCCTRNVSTQ